MAQPRVTQFTGSSRVAEVLARDLRGKVRVQTDGGLKTGLDVVKAAILGAESFGFGSTPMIVFGGRSPIGILTEWSLPGPRCVHGGIGIF